MFIGIHLKRKPPKKWMLLQGWDVYCARFQLIADQSIQVCLVVV